MSFTGQTTVPRPSQSNRHLSGLCVAQVHRTRLVPSNTNSPTKYLSEGAHWVQVVCRRGPRDPCSNRREPTGLRVTLPLLTHATHSSPDHLTTQDLVSPNPEDLGPLSFDNSHLSFRSLPERRRVELKKNGPVFIHRNRKGLGFLRDLWE